MPKGGHGKPVPADSKGSGHKGGGAHESGTVKAGGKK
jgi:hypothetical protein